MADCATLDVKVTVIPTGLSRRARHIHDAQHCHRTAVPNAGALRAVLRSRRLSRVLAQGFEGDVYVLHWAGR